MQTVENNVALTPVLESKNTVKPLSADLKKAPLKILAGKEKGRKELFEKSALEKSEYQILHLMPKVLNKLQESGHIVEFCNFIRLVSEDKFPLRNISWLLFLDVVRWYSLQTTTQMTYSEESMKFWKVLYRLFHGKALRFMSGLKSTGQVTGNETEKGCFDPQNTAINFAVPNQNSIIVFETVDVAIPKEIAPGVIPQAMDMKDKSKSYVLGFDGKKLAPGLSKDGGDQDLFGHEEGETLSQVKQRVSEQICYIEAVARGWETMENELKLSKIEKIISILSLSLKDLRTLFMKLRLMLKRFQKDAGEDWRNSRFVYAISSVQAQIYQIKSVVQRLLDANDSLLKIGSSLNLMGHAFTSTQEVDICSQSNVITLKEPENLPPDYVHNLRFTKQRTQEWFQHREQVKVTGSKVFEALGLDSLKKQQAQFDKVIKGVHKDEDISDDVKARMEHGTKSEIHAVATLSSKILPFYFPGFKYIEEGAHLICNESEPLVLVSPDGSLGTYDVYSNDVPIPFFACEFKCPVPTDYKTPVHYQIPLRYGIMLMFCHLSN